MLYDLPMHTQAYEDPVAALTDNRDVGTVFKNMYTTGRRFDCQLVPEWASIDGENNPSTFKK